MLSLFSRIKALKLTPDGSDFPKGAQFFQIARRTKLDPATNESNIKGSKSNGERLYRSAFEKSAPREPRGGLRVRRHADHILQTFQDAARGHRPGTRAGSSSTRCTRPTRWCGAVSLPASHEGGCGVPPASIMHLRRLSIVRLTPTLISGIFFTRARVRRQ
jgi:hypothetical protein